MAEKSKLKRALINWKWDLRQLLRRQPEKKEEKYERGIKTPKLQSEKDESEARIIERVEQKQDLKRQITAAIIPGLLLDNLRARKPNIFLSWQIKRNSYVDKSQ